MVASPILKIVPTVLAAGLLANNVKYLNKKKKKNSDLFELGVTNIIGVSLIKETSDFIGE